MSEPLHQLRTAVVTSHVLMNVLAGHVLVGSVLLGIKLVAVLLANVPRSLVPVNLVPVEHQLVHVRDLLSTGLVPVITAQLAVAMTQPILLMGTLMLPAPMKIMGTPGLK